MYDFWFTMGVAIIDPALLTTINNAVPVFDFVQRVIVETDQNGKQTVLPGSPSAGVLENAPTTAVREAIAGYVQTFSANNFNKALAPPIGIYCAGRFCQMMLIPAFSSANPNSKFTDIIGLANTAYLAAIGGGQTSKLPSFPAFLGLCLMDGNLVFDLVLPRPTQKVLNAAAEFGVSPNRTPLEWGIAKAFVQAPQFGPATQLLMVGNRNPWLNHATEEQVYFWDQFSEHAIP